MREFRKYDDVVLIKEAMAFVEWMEYADVCIGSPNGVAVVKRSDGPTRLGLHDLHKIKLTAIANGFGDHGKPLCLVGHALMMHWSSNERVSDKYLWSDANKDSGHRDFVYVDMIDSFFAQRG